LFNWFFYEKRERKLGFPDDEFPYLSKYYGMIARVEYKTVYGRNYFNIVVCWFGLDSKL